MGCNLEEKWQLALEPFCKKGFNYEWMIEWMNESIDSWIFLSFNFKKLILVQYKWVMAMGSVHPHPRSRCVYHCELWIFKVFWYSNGFRINKTGWTNDIYILRRCSGLAWGSFCWLQCRKAIYWTIYSSASSFIICEWPHFSQNTLPPKKMLVLFSE